MNRSTLSSTLVIIGIFGCLIACLAFIGAGNADGFTAQSFDTGLSPLWDIFLVAILGSFAVTGISWMMWRGER